MSFDNTFDESFINEVKDRNNIVDVISSYVQLTKIGDNYKGLCPFHNEKTPSFMVNETKQFFKCFGCGEGGDVIAFIMKRENTDFINALKLLCEKSGISWPEQSKMTNEEKEKLKKKQKIYQLHTTLAKFYRSCLLDRQRPGPYSYLINRGIDYKTILRFGLGYAPSGDSAKRMLLENGFTEEELILSGIFKNKNGRMTTIFYNRVMFPIFDSRSRVVGFGGRILNGNGPKYINSPTNIIYNKKDILYCLNFAKKYNFDKIILCEGYLDVISLYKSGIIGAVASLGTSLTKEQAQIIKNLGKPVYICYDSDSAGTKATLRAIQMLNKEGVDPLIINLGEYKDPDEFLKSNSKQDFNNKINAAYNSLRYSLIAQSRKYDLSQYAQKMLYINDVTSILKNHKNPIEVEIEIKRISQEFNISIKSIGKMVYGKYFSEKQFFSKNNSNSNIVIQKLPVSKATDTLEDALIKIIKNDERLILILKEKLPEKIIENFENYGYLNGLLDKYQGYDKSQFNFNSDLLDKINILTTNIKINSYTLRLNKLEKLRREKISTSDDTIRINNEIIKTRKEIDILKNELQLFGGDVNFGKGK